MYIIDLDGTIMNGAEAHHGAREFVERLQQTGKEFLIMTNSIKSPEKVQERLRKVGIKVSKDRIFNPITAINTYLKTEGISKVWSVGSFTEIEQMEVTQETESPEMIVLLDFEKEKFGYSTLQKIFDFMNKGITVISASGSKFYLKNGCKALDTGAFVTMLEAVSDKRIEILGKPSAGYFNLGIQKLGALPAEVTVIGDDWKTDMLGAEQVGCKAILVKTGKYNEGDEKRCQLLSVIDGLEFVEI